MWYHCKFHALNSTRHVLRTAKAMLQTEMAHCKSVYQQAIVRHQAEEPQPLPTKYPPLPRIAGINELDIVGLR